MSVRSARSEQNKINTSEKASSNNEKPRTPEEKRRNLSRLMAMLVSLGALLTPWSDTGGSNKNNRPDETSASTPDEDIKEDIRAEVSTLDRRKKQDIIRALQELRTIAEDGLDQATDTGDTDKSFADVMSEVGVGQYTDMLLNLRDMLADKDILGRKLESLKEKGILDVTPQQMDEIVDQLQKIEFTADYDESAVYGNGKKPVTSISHPELGELINLVRGHVDTGSEGVSVKYVGSLRIAMDEGNVRFPISGMGSEYGVFLDSDGDQADSLSDDILYALMYEFLPEQ